jgi:hypothetical protein
MNLTTILKAEMKDFKKKKAIHKDFSPKEI